MTNIGTSGTRNWGSAMRIFLALTVVSSGLLALSQQADARTHRGNGMTGIRAKTRPRRHLQALSEMGRVWLYRP